MSVVSIYVAALLCVSACLLRMHAALSANAAVLCSAAEKEAVHSSSAVQAFSAWLLLSYSAFLQTLHLLLSFLPSFL